MTQYDPQLFNTRLTCACKTPLGSAYMDVVIYACTYASYTFCTTRKGFLIGVKATYLLYTLFSLSSHTSGSRLFAHSVLEYNV